MRIFGIPIDNLSQREVLWYIHRAMESPGYHRIATVNPEFLLLARKDKKLKQALLSADLRLADGVGITWAFALQGENLKARLPGADLLDAIVRLAVTHNYRVYCAVREGGLSSWNDVRLALQKKYPALEVSGKDFDPHSLSTYEPRAISAEILLCNFGAPAQELFLAQYADVGTSLRLAIGVGGSFDYLTQKIRRAPKTWQKMGLEWLWRLKEQPQRLPRTFLSVCVFPIRLLFGKIEP